MFIFSVQKWNGGCYNSEICSVSSSLLWEELKREGRWSFWEDYQEAERGKELSVAACSKSSLFAVGGNSIFCVYHCHMMTISETQSYSKVVVYLSPCACLNTCKSK